MAEKNQTEGEFFALVGTGRKGVESMLETMGPEIAKIAAPNVGGNFDTWKARALVDVSNRDELREVLQTKPGIFSVYKALSKCATMGLQIGGQFPHAYLVPKEGKATLVVTAEGYAFAAVHGPGSVLRIVPALGKVYEKDTFRIDASAGTFEHQFEAFGDRGKIVGYYMRLEYNDGHVEIPIATRAEVVGISNAYSTKVFPSGKKAPAWSKSEEEMYDKIAAKRLLKKPAREAEGLAMLLSLDEYEEPEPRQAPPRDVTERLGGRLDDAAASFEVQDSEPEEEAEPAETGDGKEIF